LTERIETLDELRALAIGAVMLSHFALAFGSQSIVAFWLNLPDLSVGVDLFFVISGFLIFQNLADLTDKACDFTRGIAAFYARRLTRIALPAWAILTALAMANLEHPASSAADLWTAAAFVANVHWARCEVDAHCGDALATSHFWSLASEAQFYLLAPTLLLARGRAPLYAAGGQNDALPPGAAVEKDPKYPPVVSYTLRNGLKLLILEKKFVPTVSFAMTFRVGNVDCPSGKTGLAHFLIRLMPGA